MKSKFDAAQIGDSPEVIELKRQLSVYHNVERPQLTAQIEKMRLELMASGYKSATWELARKR